MRRKSFLLQGPSPVLPYVGKRARAGSGITAATAVLLARIHDTSAHVGKFGGASMHSQDVFRRALTRVAAEIDPWLQQLADVARLERGWSGEAWRVELEPHAAAACPLEILLYRSNHADIAVAGETFEGVDLGGLEGLAPLIRAITEGRIRHMTAVSAATGRPIGSNLVVDLADGRQLTLGADMAGGVDVVRRERHFAPYRR
jgi:hypothetical protein